MSNNGRQSQLWQSETLSRCDNHVFDQAQAGNSCSNPILVTVHPSKSCELAEKINVRFGSESAIPPGRANVRFAPEAVIRKMQLLMRQRVGDGFSQPVVC